MLHARSLCVLALAAASGAWSGCSGCDHAGGGDQTDGGGAIAGLKSIVVTPAQVTLTVDNGVAQTQAYTATGTFENGTSRDITGEVTWTTSDRGLGNFSGALFTSSSSRGGRGSAVASSGALSGAGDLTILFKQQYRDPGSTDLPANPGTVFNGPPSTADNVVPRLVYPDDNVLVPPNLGRLEFHFTPGGDGNAATPNSLFEVRFLNAVTDVTVYTRCPAPPKYTDPQGTAAVLTVQHGCIYTTNDTLWSWIAETNRGGDPLTVTVRGTTDDGAAVGSSKSTHLSFSFDDIQGGLYYWEIGADDACVNSGSGSSGPGCSAAHDSTAVVRFDFAAGDDSGTTFLTPQSPGSSGGTCIGCHALSRDGTQLVAEAGGQFDARILLWDVAQQKPVVPFGQADRSLFESWSPDGTQYVGVNNFSSDAAQNGTAGGAACTGNGPNCDLNLRLYDGKTSKFVADVPGTSVNNLPTDHPDWSLDGNSIAYTLVGKANGNYPNTLQQWYAGSIYVVQRAGSGWGAPIAVAPSPDDHTNYYYPAWAPDNQFLVLNRAVCPAGGGVTGQCSFDTAPTSRLFAARPVANAPLVELANANKPGPLDTGPNITNTYPKWSPFEFRRTEELGSRLMWLTFASKRHFGLRAAPAVIERNKDAGDILWMVAVDPDKVAAGEDGSYVAFALPFQRFWKSNHIAQWTTKVVPPIS
jgi:hypothetical protein